MVKYKYDEELKRNMEQISNCENYGDITGYLILEGSISGIPVRKKYAINAYASEAARGLTEKKIAFRVDDPEWNGEYTHMSLPDGRDSKTYRKVFALYVAILLGYDI